jgi:NADH dehydrogenase FAD-containing subunit
MFRPLTNLFNNLSGLFEAKLPEEQKPNVLVIGYGWGGRAFCDKIDRRKYHVEIVNIKPFFLNTPKLVQKVATGINTGVLGRISGPNVSYGNCIHINPVKNEALFTFSSENYKHNDTNEKIVDFGGFSHKYDYLVLAVGSVPNTFGIPGADTCKFLKTYNDAYLLANTLTENKDKKQKIDIIGAGPTGCELALALAAQGRTVRLLEAAPGILAGFTAETRDSVIAEMKQHGISLELNTMVRAIKEDKIQTSSGDFERGLTVWTSGIKANPLIRFLTDERLLTTDKHLRVSGYHNIYALGDIIGGRGPPTAQNARAQGHYLASHFNRGFQIYDDEYKYIESGKVIHGANSVYLDFEGKGYKFPRFFGYLFDKFRE